MTQQSPNLIKAYTRATHTVAKTRQVVMLYDGAIRFLKQAAEAMEKGEIEQRYLKLSRVSEVISGLQNCLDFTSGGNTAQVLYDFYAGIDIRVFNLHRSANPEACRQLVADLKEMRDVWDTIDRGGDNASASSAPASQADQPADAAAASAAVKFSA